MDKSHVTYGTLWYRYYPLEQRLTCHIYDGTGDTGWRRRWEETDKEAIEQALYRLDWPEGKEELVIY